MLNNQRYLISSPTLSRCRAEAMKTWNTATAVNQKSSAPPGRKPEGKLLSSGRNQDSRKGAGNIAQEIARLTGLSVKKLKGRW
jgi:hypothetical protein